MNDEPSDERLHAWIDGELTTAEAADLLQRMRSDDALRERVAQLRLTKDLVRHAYADVTSPRPAPRARAADPFGRLATVALAAVGVGALLGWMAHERAAGAADAPRPLAAHVPAAHMLAAQAPAAEARRSHRVVLHVSSASAQDGRAVLDRAEGLLDAAQAAGRTLSLEIVANGGGLDLLREDVSPHAARIAALRAAHPGLSLVACGQTAQRLRDNGVVVRLLPGTVTATSALDEIVLRMQQGWDYLRI